MNQVKLSQITDKQLSELSEKRKKEYALVKSKQSIVAELVQEAHKKEVK